MRLSYAGIIVALCLSASSGYGTALKYQANPDHLQHESRSNAENPQAPSASASVTTDHQSIGSASNDKSKEGHANAYEWLLKWLEPIVIVTAIYALVSYFLLRSINKQGAQIDQQIMLADNLGRWTAESANHARRQWRATHEQDITLREQLQALKETAEAAKRSADALIEIERPWIQVLIDKIDIPPPGTSTSRPFVNIWPRVCSVGRTPARTIIIVFAKELLQKEPDSAPDVPPALRAEPDYSHGFSVPREWLVVSGTGIEPMPVQVTVEDWNAVKKRELFLYVYGCVVYMGAGGNDYETNFCEIYWVPYGASDASGEGFRWSANTPEAYTRIS